MNKNTVRKLADNPYYSMNDRELKHLSELLKEEAKLALEDEQASKFKTKKVNKNRVNKINPEVPKTPTLEED